MKNFALIVIMGILMLGGSIVYAESTSAGYGLAQNSMNDLVAKVLILDGNGFTQDEIVAQLLGNRSLENNQITLPAVSHKKINFGQFKKSLREGDSDENIKDLQENLNKLSEKYGLSFGILVADGKYGPATAGVVRLFQAYQKLGVDGVFGSKTLEKLEGFFDDHDDDDDECEFYADGSTDDDCDEDDESDDDHGDDDSDNDDDESDDGNDDDDEADAAADINI